jgi:hypothetical protein
MVLMTIIRSIRIYIHLRVPLRLHRERIRHFGVSGHEVGDNKVGFGA